MSLQSRLEEIAQADAPSEIPTVTCPNCQTEVVVDELDGDNRCPTCGRFVEVPLPDGGAPDDDQAQHFSAATPSSQRPASRSPTATFSPRMTGP